MKPVEESRSLFLIQVVYKATGEVVQWAPGLMVERELVTELCSRVAAKGVGIGRTTAHVVKDVREALQELLLDLKRDIQAPGPEDQR